jgi:hypothetical protein
MTERIPGALGRVLRSHFLAADAFDLVLRIGLVYLLIDELQGPYAVRVVVFIACGAGLALGQQRASWVWGALTAVLAAKVGLDWIRVDNHAWLTVYWCCACWIAVTLRDPRVLVRSGQGLIGFCMAFAVIWKVLLVDDFMSGSFFVHTFLWDGRFSELAAVLGRIDPALLAENRVMVEAQIATARLDSVMLHGAPLLVPISIALAWLTVLLEGAIAVAFIGALVRGVALVEGQPASRLFESRDWLLVAFCFSTYILARVGPFGFLLALMGLAQCERERPWARLAYLASMVVVTLYDWLPWRDWLLALLGPS